MHVHEWVETQVYCEDCGDHAAVYCNAEVEPPCPYEEPVDLVGNDDPRVGDYSWVFAAPVVKRYPVIMETRQTYLLWIEDDEQLGQRKLIERLHDSGDAYEYLEGATPVDGDFEVVKLDEYAYEWHVRDALTQHGPWPTCPMTDCKRTAYPAYGIDPYCWEHRPLEEAKK